jgi:hypothetical protein
MPTDWPMRKMTRAEEPTMTQVKVDEKLVDDAVRLGHHRTQDEAAAAALREYVEKLQPAEDKPKLDPSGLIELFGKIEYWPDYDYKEGRRKR